MGSPIIGRADCPVCDFKSAHVKKSEKCHFLYCPECGTTIHARNERQVELLLKRMRPADGAPPPTPKPTEPLAPEVTPQPTPTPTQPPAPRRHGLFT